MTIHRLRALLCFFTLALIPRLEALDFFLRPGGFFFVPIGNAATDASGNTRYGFGFGGDLGVELDFAGIWPNPLGLSYSLGLEGAFHAQTMQSAASDTLQILSGGGVFGLGWYPFSRLWTRLDVSGGVYQPSQGGTGGNTGLWWRGGGEIGFRITPLITIAANAGWKEYSSGGKPFNSGVYTGIKLQLTVETGAKTNSAGAASVFVQDDAVYPVFLALYKENPVGTLSIRNNENAEIRDVRVSFRAGDYTSSEFDCGSVPLIAKGRSADFPLFADFSQEVLRFADTGRILGEVVIRYRFLGQERQAIQTAGIAVHNHNAYPQGESAAIAAFISPTSPEVLEFAKNVTGLARANSRMGFNQKMEAGVWLFEGVRSLIAERPATNETGGQAQFPAQTLSYTSGTVEDMALLYAAALEASAIRSALIAMPNGDLLAAFDLGLYRDDAATAALFNGLDRLLLLGEEVWLPVAMYKTGEGFTAAWSEGVARIDALLAGEETAEMVIIEDAWASYPPAPFPVMNTAIAQPEPSALIRAANSAMEGYIGSELTPKLAALQVQLRANPTAALYNQIGNLYLRSGDIANAKASYERAAVMGSIGAMTNRGNIALNENDNAAAERWFREALAKEPENRTALRGLETVEARK
jgi:tetratricopeptide (TPR) repeat protein